MSNRLQPGRAAARGVALFLGGFALLNLGVGWVRPGFDANGWWIDLRIFPDMPADGVVGGSAIFMLAWAIFPQARRWRRIVTTSLLGLMAMLALGNAAAYYVVLLRGEIRAGVPAPMSLLIAMTLGAIGWMAWRSTQAPAGKRWGHGLLMLAVVIGCGIGFPLGQMFLFGKTDYRRPADAILVLGARVYADGRLSDALADRVRTGCKLYHDGLAPRMVMSGGPGDGAVHETQAMRAMAMQLGVPAEAIEVDEAGVNSEASVANYVRGLAGGGETDQEANEEARSLRPGAKRGNEKAGDSGGRVLVVSHWWHLPRLKLAFGRRAGVQALTVPAVESYRLSQTPYLLAREVAAWWKYYLCAGG